MHLEELARGKKRLAATAGPIRQCTQLPLTDVSVLIKEAGESAAKLIRLVGGEWQKSKAHFRDGESICYWVAIFHVLRTDSYVPGAGGH